MGESVDSFICEGDQTGREGDQTGREGGAATFSYALFDPVPRGKGSKKG